MIEATTQQTTEQTPPGIRPGPTAMAMCPMAKMCKGMMEKPPSAFLLMLPGAVLIVVGVLIFLEPRILVWLIGAGCVLFGIMLFMMSNFIRKLGVQARNM